MLREKLPKKKEKRAAHSKEMCKIAKAKSAKEKLIICWKCPRILC